MPSEAHVRNGRFSSKWPKIDVYGRALHVLLEFELWTVLRRLRLQLPASPRKSTGALPSMTGWYVTESPQWLVHAHKDSSHDMCLDHQGALLPMARHEPASYAGARARFTAPHGEVDVDLSGKMNLRNRARIP